jgi:hypothetical protein
VGEEHRLKVFDDNVLRKILGPKREDITGEETGENYVTEIFIIFNFYQILFRVIKSVRLRWVG